jgi:hypothetical protein
MGFPCPRRELNPEGVQILPSFFLTSHLPVNIKKRRTNRENNHKKEAAPKQRTALENFLKT